MKIKLFINQYNLKGIKFPSEKDIWKKIERNNTTIALTVLYPKNEKIYSAYVSKQMFQNITQIVKNKLLF